MNKEFPARLDVRDDGGAGIATLPAADADRVAVAALVECAAQVLEERVPSEVEERLRELVAMPEREATAWLQAAAKEPGSTWSRLMEDRPFGILAWTFIGNRLVLADLPLKPGTRRALRYSYEMPLARRGRSLPRRMAEALGWSHYSVLIATLGGESDSYRLEVTVPGDDLWFREATLTAIAASGGTVAHGASRTTAGGVSSAVVSLTRTAAVRTLARVSIAPRPGGFLLLCLIATAFAAAVLLVGSFRLDEFRAKTEAVVTILALGPTVLLGLLVRQGEHGLATRIFSGIRRMLLLSGAATLAGMLALVGGACDAALRAIWMAATVVAVGAALTVLVSHLRSTRGA